jgi:hypothetical protein
MNEEELELQAQAEITNKNTVEDRMKNLSKAKLEAEAKAEAEAKSRAEAEAKVQTAEKERDFYASFSDSISKYPSANEHKDAIKEKVMSGYTVEDATVSVLAKEGKLGSVQAPPPPRQSPAGGSASNQIGSNGSKPLGEMTREEKRQAILDAESRGDISNN